MSLSALAMRVRGEKQKATAAESSWGALGWAPPAHFVVLLRPLPDRAEGNTAREGSLCSSPEVRNIPQITPGMSLAGQQHCCPLERDG